jgi:hypothetical protein
MKLIISYVIPCSRGNNVKSVKRVRISVRVYVLIVYKMFVPSPAYVPSIPPLSIFDQPLLLDPNILLSTLFFVYSKLFHGFVLNYT